MEGIPHLHRVGAQALFSLIEMLAVDQTLDLGAAQLQIGVHPTHGRVLVVSTVEATGAWVKL